MTTSREYLGLNLPAIAATLTTITGHAQGTYEHESMFGRVVANLANGDVAHVRDNGRRITHHLHREDYEK